MDLALVSFLALIAVLIGILVLLGLRPLLARLAARNIQRRKARMAAGTPVGSGLAR